MGPKVIESMQQEIDALRQKHDELEESLKVVDDRLNEKTRKFDKVERELHQMQEKFQILVQWIQHVPKSMPQSLLAFGFACQDVEQDQTESENTVNVPESPSKPSGLNVSESSRSRRSHHQLAESNTKTTESSRSNLAGAKIKKDLSAGGKEKMVHQQSSGTSTTVLRRTQRQRIKHAQKSTITSGSAEQLAEETSSKALKIYTKKDLFPTTEASTSLSPSSPDRNMSVSVEEMECQDNDTGEDELTEDPLETETKYVPDINLDADLSENPDPASPVHNEDTEKGSSYKANKNETKVPISKTNNKFNCSICGNQYSANSGLARHMNSHTRQVEYPCKKCGLVFLRKDRLNVHQKTRRCKAKVQNEPVKVKLGFRGIHIYS